MKVLKSNDLFQHISIKCPVCAKMVFITLTDKSYIETKCPHVQLTDGDDYALDVDFLAIPDYIITESELDNASLFTWDDFYKICKYYRMPGGCRHAECNDCVKNLCPLWGG